MPGPACTLCTTDAVARVLLRATLARSGVTVRLCTRHLLRVLSGHSRVAPYTFWITELIGRRG